MARFEDENIRMGKEDDNIEYLKKIGEYGIFDNRLYNIYMEYERNLLN